MQGLLRPLAASADSSPNDGTKRSICKMEHKHNIAAVSILFARRESILKRFFPMIGDDISRDTAKFDYESVLAKMRGMTPQEAAAAAAQAVAEAEVALDEAEEALREAEAAEADAKVDEAFAEAAAYRALRKRKAREMKRRLMGSGA